MKRVPPPPGPAVAAAARAAARSAADAPQGRRLHDARVAAKRLRSLWRLLRPVVGADESRRRCRALSRAARVLSDARDLESQRDVAFLLAGAERGPFAAPLRALARRLPHPPSRAALAGPLAALGRALDLSAAALDDAAVRASAAGVGRGLERLERRMGRALSRTRRHRGPDDFHACRKRAKDLQYALEALGAPAARIRPFARAAEKLGRGRDLARLAGHADAALARELARRALRLEAAALAAL